MSIYVVDDNSNLCEFMACLLSSQGYMVHVFNNPDDALKYLRKGDRPSILISDFNLPKMNGYALHQAVLKDTPKLKTIIISGRNVMDDIGHLPFLQKPFQPDQLLSLVHACKQAG